MRRALAVVAGLCSLIAGLVVPRAASASTLSPIKTGGLMTVAASPVSDTFTFHGHIEFNGDVFEGTASGTSSLQPDETHNLIPSFTLQGPNLTGTCSGQWLVGPQQGLPPIPLAEFPVPVPAPGSPVVEGSLDCALVGGDGFSHQVGLTMALVELGVSGQYAGAFGPAIWSLGGNIGAADVTNFGLYDLVGQLFGFEGEVSGHEFYGPGTPFALSGTNGQGFTLSEQCQDNTPYLPDAIPYLVRSLPPAAVPAIRLLSCTGNTGDGQLLLVLPVAQATNPYCVACATERTGVFVGI